MENYQKKTATILCLGKEFLQARSGGLNRYIHELSNQLIKDGNCVELYAYGMTEPSSHPNLHFIDLGSPEQFIGQRLFSAYTKLLAREGAPIDAVNLHFAPYSFPLLPILPKDIPITFTFHGPWALESQAEFSGNLNVRVKAWLEENVYRRCDRFIVLSKAFGNILHEIYKVPWEKISVIPGGVNIERFQPTFSQREARIQMGWSLDRPILFTPRRLVHRMGVDNLLRAICTIRATIPEIWLAVAGKGPLQNTLEQQVKELNLEEYVSFLGFLPDERLPIAYQAADLTVIPTRSFEGFGLVLLESLASGTPALCTPIGGMPEVLTPFKPELITQSIEDCALAERIVDFLTDNLELPSRQACRDYAVQNFSWDLISQHVLDVLLEPKV
jgi:glycosyltransferase involved in cell wall biosynthesis